MKMIEVSKRKLLLGELRMQHVLELLIKLKKAILNITFLLHGDILIPCVT